MRVAAVQHDIAWEDPATNFRRLAPLVASAAGDGADLVALTEMFATGFSMATDRIAEAPDGPSATFLIDQATTHGVWVAGSLPERAAGADRPTNRLVLAAPDGTTHRYSKIHPFSYAGEDEHYTAGSETLTVDIGGVRVTPFVCYDLRFADLFWNAAVTTDCYLVVANWPAPRNRHWSTLLRSRAIENQAYVVGVNRVGRGGELDYTGASAIIDPMGVDLATGGPDETTITADIDPAVVADVRTTLPFMSDRRA